MIENEAAGELAPSGLDKPATARRRRGPSKKLSNKRRIAVELARAGHATLAEIADLANVPRQTVRYWCIAARIDVNETRSKWLAKAWRRLM